MNRFERQCRYEEEGAVAANEGKRREDCPYPKEDSEAWNFWVYGNENEQGKLVTEYMRLMGTKPICFTTGDLTPEMERQSEEWASAYKKAERQLREQRGWKI